MKKILSFVVAALVASVVVSSPARANVFDDFTSSPGSTPILLGVAGTAVGAPALGVPVLIYGLYLNNRGAFSSDGFDPVDLNQAGAIGIEELAVIV